MTEALVNELHTTAPVLLSLFLRSVLLLAAAAVLVRLLNRASAAWRHLVWASALLALLVLPLASALAPTVSLRILPPGSRAPTSSSPAPFTTDVRVASPRPDDAAREAERAATSGGQGRARAMEMPLYTPALPAGEGGAEQRQWSWQSALVALWAVVAFVMLAEVIRSRLRLRRLASGAWRIHDPAWWRAAARIGSELGLRRPVLLMATARTSVPLTWGWRAPIVLLPADAHRWPAERREAVLVHELAHVARGDALGHEIARLVAALFWANPLVWIALRGMRSERERACDDLVLVTGTRASSYAGDLLEIARATVATRQTPDAALAMARPSELEGRLLAILDAATPREPVSRVLRIRGAVLALALVVPLSALRPVERSAAEARRTAAPPPVSVTLPEVSSEPVIGRSPYVPSDRRPLAQIPDTVPDTSSGSAGMEALQPSDLQPLVEAPQGVPQTLTGQPDDDLETLLAVARAAAGISSSNDKAELLLAVLERRVLNDSLQRTILRSAATISSGYERHRVLLAMVRQGVAPGSETAFLGAAEGISGNHERALVLGAFAKGHGLTDASVRQAYLRAATSITSTHERTRLLALVIGLPEFDNAAAVDLLPAIKALTSNYEKANLLVALARRGVAGDPAVRAAFISAVSTLSSSSEYRRVMESAGFAEPDRRQ